MTYFIGIAMGAMAMIAIYLELWPRFILPKLYIKREFSTENCYIGDEIDYDWTIGNRSKLPLSWMRLETELPAGLEMDGVKSEGDEWVDFRSIIGIPAESEFKTRYRCCFSKRGYYLFKDLRYDTTDHLGMRKYHGCLSDQTHIFVYPQIRLVDALIEESQIYNGNIEVKRWVVEDPLIPIGNRDYTQSDPMKFVDWNATAKLGKFQVKKFSYTTERATMFLLNSQTKDYFWEGTENDLLERMIETIATYVSSYEKKMETYGFSSNCPVQEGSGGVMIACARGRKQFHKVFRALSQITHFNQCPIEEVIRYNVKHNPKQTRMVVVSGVLNDEILDSIALGIRSGFEFEVISTKKMLAVWDERLKGAKCYALKEAAHEI